ncbi:unnamed protein product, partial [Timema podura]|nr:unnamed protein product [Timema podura]
MPLKYPGLAVSAPPLLGGPDLREFYLPRVMLTEDKLKKRNFSAKVSPAQVCTPKASQIQTTVLPNKLVVTSIDSSYPISRVSILFSTASYYPFGLYALTLMSSIDSSYPISRVSILF